MDNYDDIDTGMASRDDMMNRLEHDTQVFRNPRIKEAFQNVDRKDFVPGDYRPEAYEDYALPIGCGGTISQPTTVAFMLELLDPREGETVLDVGSGSGFTTVLLAELVGESGKVIALEIVPELVELGRNNLSKYNYPHVEIHEAKEGEVYKYEKSFDKILVSAGAKEIPQTLIDALREGGTMVIPVKNEEGSFSIVQLKKREGGGIEEKKYPGFAFVDLK